MNMDENNQTSLITFSWFDYTLFTLMLALSAVIGVYFGFVKKRATRTEYLLGGKQMNVFPIAMSLIASSISGITLLAVPAEIYRYGATYWLCAPIMFVVVALTHYIYLPVFYNLQITSIYEYLKFRFNGRVRLFSSLLYTISALLYLPVVIYVPALALSQGTGINIHLITPIVCGVCIFYTTIGGLKAVVWTDAFQFVIMIAAIMTVFSMGIISAGGFGTVWKTSRQHRRLDIDFDFDLTKRDTVWSGTIAMAVSWTCYTAANQGFIQKCLSLPVREDVTKALKIFVVGKFLVITFSVLTGLIMFTKYQYCDPLSSGAIKLPDQLLPYYVIDVARSIPGLPGLFMSGIFSAALSTLSAGLNCLAGVVYEDFISPFISKSISEERIGTILKWLVVTLGLISTAFVFVVEHLGSILPLVISLSGVTNGPLLGLFTVGMVVPMVNSKGALCGGISSLVIMTWIVFRSQLYKSRGVISYPVLPTSVENCTIFFNETSQRERILDAFVEEPHFIYKISYYYYPIMGMLIVFAVSVAVSIFTHSPPVSKKYLTPLIYPLLSEFESDPPEYYSVENALKMTAANVSDRKQRN